MSVYTCVCYISLSTLVNSDCTQMNRHRYIYTSISQYIHQPIIKQLCCAKYHPRYFKCDPLVVVSTTSRNKIRVIL